MNTERIERDRAKLPADGATAARAAAIVATGSTRRGYAPPRLRALGSAADLLEILGPAQANYFGP